MSYDVSSTNNALIKNSVNKIIKITNYKVKWIILFGSLSKNEERKDSDIDLCVYLETGKKERFQTRMKILSSLNEKFDVQTFQDLPIMVRMEILKGKVIYCNDITHLNDIAYYTIKEYNLFEHSYKLYLDNSDL